MAVAGGDEPAPVGAPLTSMTFRQRLAARAETAERRLRGRLQSLGMGDAEAARLVADIRASVDAWVWEAPSTRDGDLNGLPGLAAGSSGGGEARGGEGCGGDGQGRRGLAPGAAATQ